MLLLALVASTSATRLAAAGTFCAVTHYPNPSIYLWCDGSTTVSEVAFADWGLSTATACGHYTPNASCTCAAAASQLVRRLCLGRNNCTLPDGDELNKLVGGDPCSGTAKTLRVEAACSSGAAGHSAVPPPPTPPPAPPAPPPPHGPDWHPQLRQLKVEYAVRPLAIDVPAPTFSWELQHPGRGVVQRSFSLSVRKRGARSWHRRSQTSNASIFVALPEGLVLESDTSYEWQVEVQVALSHHAHAGGGNLLIASSLFSTGLLATSDWDAHSAWLVASASTTPMPPRCVACAPTAQLRRDFTLPAGPLTRARLFVAIPGVGRVSLNGEAVDGVVGTRSRSQYDIRSLYTTFDVAPLLRLGAANTLGVTIAGGWW
jgi:hypothetical protein